MKIKHFLYKFMILFICVLCFSCFAFADSENDPEEFIVYQDETGSTHTEVLRVSASDTNGFHSVILSLLGDYNPIATTTEYRYPSGTGYQNRYQVDVTPDYSWIASACIFAIVLYCALRFIGGIFSGR